MAKNKRIRKAMTDAEINQLELSEILGVNPAELTHALKYELAVREQNEIVARIREWDALRRRAIPR